MLLNQISRTLDTLGTPTPNILICGDFNLPPAMWTNGTCSPGATREEQIMVQDLFHLAMDHLLIRLVDCQHTELETHLTYCSATMQNFFTVTLHLRWLCLTISCWTSHLRTETLYLNTAVEVIRKMKVCIAPLGTSIPSENGLTVMLWMKA